jgi:hypothetical protein
MDLLGSISEESRDAAEADRVGHIKLAGGETAALLLAGMPSPLAPRLGSQRA